MKELLIVKNLRKSGSICGFQMGDHHVHKKAASLEGEAAKKFADTPSLAAMPFGNYLKMRDTTY